MRGGLAFTLVFVRTASAIVIALLLLGMLFEAYHRGGPPELGTVFGVIQGVLLSTMAYLFTTQAVDRAEAEVVAEVKQRSALEASVSERSTMLEELVLEFERMQRIVDVLERDPELRRRIEELERQGGE